MSNNVCQTLQQCFSNIVMGNVIWIVQRNQTTVRTLPLSGIFRQWRMWRSLLRILDKQSRYSSHSINSIVSASRPFSCLLWLFINLFPFSCFCFISFITDWPSSKLAVVYFVRTNKTNFSACTDCLVLLSGQTKARLLIMHEKCFAYCLMKNESLR